MNLDDPEFVRAKRAELEKQLGPADKFILTDANWMVCREWAIVSGYLASAAVAPGVSLSNLYHQHGPKAKPAVDPMTALLKSLHETGYAPMNVDRVRDIARECVDADRATLLEIMSDEIVNRINDHLNVPKAPLVIHVERPEGVQVLDGIQHEATPEVIETVLLGDDVMLVGPAGCGKTTIGEQVAKALNLPFYVTSTVFDTHELLGYMDGMGNYHSTPFRRAFETGGVWVADELDAWDAAALLSINSALANGFVSFPDNQISVNRHPDFCMIGTANTFGKGADRVYVGRNELDAASLDRFAVIAVDYDANLESHLCGGNIEWYLYVTNVRRQVEAKNIRHVVSTRAIVKGARALRNGRKVERVREIYLFKGMSESDRKKLSL